MAIDANDRSTLNNLAWLMATEESGALADGPAAVKFAERLCSLDQPPTANSLDTLAASYAQAKRFDDAILAARQAIEAAQNAKDDALVEEIRGHLQRFENGQPLR